MLIALKLSYIVYVRVQRDQNGISSSCMLLCPSTILSVSHPDLLKSFYDIHFDNLFINLKVETISKSNKKERIYIFRICTKHIK